MLLMEMVGRRRNYKPLPDQSSQICFPTWIYDQFQQGEDIGVGDVTDVEKDVVRKMVIVALWCIQMNPAICPSMSRVLEMFESEVERLEMPPKPCLFPCELPTADRASLSPAAQLTISLDART
ncbi:hypothetical protein SLEP1_g3307 [Rubroshorea leprosula]|uniref:Uncharacterized protein n=1 Tax=Rubroshorea leprosula TaxID=152421 RepID=A0AAV5HUJ1_9ROSI|nr:hypothetical protein SLEP1_g3307 [Rubroshorea leprosula]